MIGSPALAAELVARKVDVIVSQGGSAPAIAAKKATATIPVVFVTGGDPIVDGLVTGLARPIGNVTGVTWISSNLGPKRLELLREISPHATTFALMVNPGRGRDRIRHTDRAGCRAQERVQLHALTARNEAEIHAAFAAAAQSHDGGMIVGVDAYFGQPARQDRGAASAPWCPDDLRLSRIRHARGLDQLWAEPCWRPSARAACTPRRSSRG